MLNKTIRTIAILSVVVLSIFIGKSTVKTASAATLACVDSDGGINPNVLGTTVISSPALPETRNDSCLNLEVVTQNGTTTTSWVEGITGTHVSEFSCVDPIGGSFMNSVHLCEFGCNNGACNPAPKSYSVTKSKVEGKGVITEATEKYITINNVVSHYNSSTVIKLNYQTSLMIGQKAMFKGFKNSDGSVTLTKIELGK